MQKILKIDINKIFRIGMKNNFIHGASTSIEKSLLLDDVKISKYIIDNL